MTHMLDNVKRQSVVTTWGGGVGQISGFGPLNGLVYWLGWQYPGDVLDHICFVQFFRLPRGGTLGRPLPGDVPDYSYDFGQFNTIIGVTLEIMGGRPIELEGGWIVMSQTGETFEPVNNLTTLGTGTLIFSTTTPP